MARNAVRDLYDILEVSRDASDEEIKRAYRKKARTLHPDAGGDEEQFKELTTAYEVLKNPEARANYDRFGDPRGPAGAGGGGFPGGGLGDLSDLIDAFFGRGAAGFGGAARGGPQPGRDAMVDVRVTLEEAAAGVSREVDVTLLRGCDTCDGAGTADGTRPRRCSRCEGRGQVQQVTRSVFGQMLTTSPCPTCRGTGEEITSPCPACSGEGRRRVTETVTVPVPPGVDEGRRLRISGRGEAGQRSAPPGDLYVRVHVSPHDVFEREGHDLHCQVRVPMVQAVLGVELELPTLDGMASVVVPAGTQPADVVRIRGRGMPKLNGGGARGDLFVHCKVEIPKRLPEEEAALVRQLAELRGEDEPPPNGDGTGVWERVRRTVFGA